MLIIHDGVDIPLEKKSSPYTFLFVAWLNVSLLHLNLITKLGADIHIQFSPSLRVDALALVIRHCAGKVFASRPLYRLVRGMNKNRR